MSGTARGQRSIQSRQLLAWTQTDPKIHARLKGGLRDRRLGCPAPRSRIALPCPPLRLQDPYQGTGILSWTLSHLKFCAYCTLSGSSSGATSEYPVCKATGKIAQRDFARCAAVVSKMKSMQDNGHLNVVTDVTRLPSPLSNGPHMEALISGAIQRRSWNGPSTSPSKSSA